MNNYQKFTVVNENETDILGERLVEMLPVPSVVALIGTLGAGKTRLVQAVAKAVGIDPQTVSSPTFVLVHEYQGKNPIYHFDVYRLKDDDEFLQLGPDEYFEKPGYCFIEWADKIESCLPTNYVEIRIEITGETEREFFVKTY